MDNRLVGRGYKGAQETFGCGSHVHYFDCSDNFMGVWICQIIHFKHIWFIKCQLYWKHNRIKIVAFIYCILNFCRCYYDTIKTVKVFRISVWFSYFYNKTTVLQWQIKYLKVILTLFNIWLSHTWHTPLYPQNRILSIIIMGVSIEYSFLHPSIIYLLARSLTIGEKWWLEGGEEREGASFRISKWIRKYTTQF